MLKHQSQFELFPGGVPGVVDRKATSRFSIPSLTLTLENMVVTGVVFLVALVVVFSLGVERGKRLAARAGTPVAVQQGMETIDSNTVVTSEPLVVARAEFTAPAAALTSISHNPVPQPQVMDKALEPISTKEAAPEKSVDKTASLDKILTIQVASFLQQDRADREANTLKGQGKEAFVTMKGKHYIVCVGRFKERPKASVMWNQLRKKYKDCLIRSL